MELLREERVWMPLLVGGFGDILKLDWFGILVFDAAADFSSTRKRTVIN